MNILHLDSSIMGDNSVSRLLTAKLVQQLTRENSTATVTYHDLAAAPLTHLSGGLYAAQALSADQRTPEQQRDVETSAQAMEEFLAAEVIVIGAPMYNFSISSQLKAWIDRIAVAGKTFRYTANGPEGLAGGKKVVIVSSRGGFYGAGTPQAVLEHEESYLRTVFGFLGITDIEAINAEGVALGAEQRNQAIAKAQQQIEQYARAA